ncbi:MAG TPA: hypothetical protein VML75_26450 [Kofleriaceae bacterium]|nr:hypothetical protein [Kofleriaceae bacterium]
MATAKKKSSADRPAGGGAKKSATAAAKAAAKTARAGKAMVADAADGAKAGAAKKRAAKTAVRAVKKASKAAARAAEAARKATKKATRKASKTATRAARTIKGRRAAAVHPGDPSLFVPFTAGERADALRVLTEDKRLSQMAKVGRYRVVTVEPLTVKQPVSLAGHRLARIVIYDYASDRCVDGCVDLDQSLVATLRFTRAQPMLSRDEEAAAISIALADDRVKAELSLSDEAQAAMHYWSDRDTDLAFSRRSAAVIFGRPGARPSLMAIVDLLDGQVTEVIPGGSW